MKMRVLLAALAVVAAAVFLTAPGFTKEEPEKGPPSPSEIEEAWKALGTPGANHAWMDFMVGNWKADVKYWVGPGEPLTSQGTTTTRWILEKRFLRTEYEGEADDMAFYGQATMGFNNATGKYEHVWVDSMSTALTYAAGKREGDVMTLTGEAQIPLMGTTPFRACFTKVSDAEYTMEEWRSMPGVGEFKAVEIRYKRKE